MTPTPVAARTPEQQDESNLDLLKWLFYVYSGIVLLSAAIAGALFVFAVGGFSYASQEHHSSGREMELGMAMLGTIFAMVIVLLLAKAVAVFFAARYLGERSHHLFVFVVSIICALNFPIGTALGAATLYTLSKDTVKRRFGV